VKYTDLRELEGSVLPMNGEPVRWAPLSTLLGTAPQMAAPNQPHCPFILIQQEGRHVAVAVDDVEEEGRSCSSRLAFP